MATHQGVKYPFTTEETLPLTFPIFYSEDSKSTYNLQRKERDGNTFCFLSMTETSPCVIWQERPLCHGQNAPITFSFSDLLGIPFWFTFASHN